jgi:predicted nucleotidyltransferase
MKAVTQQAATKTREKTSGLRRKPLPDSKLPPEAQELRRQFREWNDSFQSRAKRMAFIRRLCQRIATAYQPEKIILFGSHAYGTPTPESDVDLMIVMNYEGRLVEQMLKIQRELDIVTPVDLLIRTPADFARRLAEGDMFIRLIAERGKVMYEAKH